MGTLRHARMLEAMRLTRAGQLMEATDIIQSLLTGDRGTAGAPSAPMSRTSKFRAPVTIDGTAERIDETAAKAPRAKQSRTPPDRVARQATHVPPRSPLPPLMHGFPVHSGLDGAEMLARLKRHARPRPSVPVPVPDGAQFVLRNFTGAAGARDYKLYIPSGYRGETVPLIVMLHGCTQSADDFAVGTQMNALAEEQGFLVAYPIQAKSANGSGCWNWFKPADQRRDGGEPSLIAGITHRVASDYAVDPDRIYVTGLSAGGAAAAIMGAVYPDVYAAAGVHSGLPVGAAKDLPSAFAAMRQGARGDARPGRDTAFVPTIVFHGAQDTTVHPSNGHHVIEQSLSGRSADLRTQSHNGRTAAGRSYSRTCHLDADGRAVVEIWLVDGVGHAWSGGHGAGSYTDPDGPPASREMVRFFMQHRRSAPPSP